MADKGDDKKFYELQEDDDEQEVLPDGEAMAKEIQEDISQQMHMHFSRLEDDVRNVFSQRMEAIESNLTNQMSERVLTAQSDILKTNKIFRDICRPLGAKWKDLFAILTADLPADTVNAELTIIEKQSPLIRPYKSLMSWKEIRGSTFNIEEIVPALRALNLSELAEKADAVLHRNTNDDLFDLSSIGKSPDDEKGAVPPRTRAVNIPSRTSKSSATRVQTLSTDGEEASAASPEISSGPSRQHNLQASASSPPSSTLSAPACAEEAIDDRHLLQLARKIADSWDKLAKALKVSQNDISDIMTSEGSLNYQGAFRMLWIWRESRSGEAEGSVDQLTAALTRIGRPDLVGLLKC